MEEEGKGGEGEEEEAASKEDEKTILSGRKSTQWSHC